MNALKDFVYGLLINYKQTIITLIVLSALFSPFYIVKDMQIESIKIESMSEQIGILNETQKTIIFHENEIDMQREFIQMQNEIINDLVNEIKKLRGIPLQPRPPRSEA